jgi:hypothetical protein
MTETTPPEREFLAAAVNEWHQQQTPSGGRNH